MENYAILQKIGEGGTSEVYLAQHSTTGLKCAVKIIYSKQEEYQQLIEEWKLLGTLNHSGIPKVFDYYEDEKAFYLVEELIVGETLDKYIVSHAINTSKIIKIMLGLCEIIHYLHSAFEMPIYYRDLKPCNIIITSNLEVKLIDFGCARQRSELLKEEYVGITPKYAAPEQRAREDIDQRTDVYGIGRVISSTISQYCNISISKGLQKIILRATRERKSERYESVKQLQEALQTLLIQEKSGTKSKTISVIGSQSRIGCTYISIILSKLLQGEVLIKEMGDSAAFDVVFQNIPYQKKEENVYCYNGINIMPRSSLGAELKEYSYILQDCGVEKDTSKINADLIIAVVGIREWEIDYARTLIAKLRHNTNVIFVVNMVMEKFENKNTVGIPYITNPYKPPRSILHGFILKVEGKLNEKNA